MVVVEGNDVVVVNSFSLIVLVDVIEIVGDDIEQRKLDDGEGNDELLVELIGEIVVEEEEERVEGNSFR